MVEAWNLDSSLQHPVGISEMRKMLFIPALQYGSQEPYVALEHLKYDSCKWGVCHFKKNAFIYIEIAMCDWWLP